MFCSRCGTSLADGSQFCVECGHTVEGSFPAAPAPGGNIVCRKCGKNIYPGAHFCPNCATAVPPPAVVVTDSAAAAAAAPASEAIPWPRPKIHWGRWLFLGMLLLAGAAIAWVATTDNSIAPQIKAYLVTAHVETIADGSVAIKPHGFASYRVNVPDGAIDVVVSGQFDASGRSENDLQGLLLTDAEFVIWQSGYATSPFYDSGKVPSATMLASLPSRPATYYLIFSNKPSRTEKTVHFTTALHYDTWMPDSALYLRDKIKGWFE